MAMLGHPLPNPLALRTKKGLAIFEWSYMARDNHFLMLLDYRGFYMTDIFHELLEHVPLFYQMTKDIDYYLDALWC